MSFILINLAIELCTILLHFFELRSGKFEFSGLNCDKGTSYLKKKNRLLQPGYSLAKIRDR